MRRELLAGLAVCAGALALAAPAGAQAPSPVLALSFDEGQGSKAGDSSPARNDGTITGAQWSSAGRFGRALAFDGDDVVRIADAASLDVTQLTMEAWVRPRSNQRWGTVMMRQFEDWDIAYGLYASSPDGQHEPSAFSGEFGIRGDQAVPLNRWTHLAATFDGATWRLYVDGVLVCTEEAGGPLPANANPLTIGFNDLWSDEGFDGLIDEVRLYGTALTQAQIASDRDARIGSASADALKPVLAMGFEAGAGSTVSDGSTFGNHGQIRGARWTTSGKYGKGLMFDGVDDWVSIPDSASLTLRDELTLEAWVKPRVQRPFATIFTKDNGPSWITYQLYASGPSSGSGPQGYLAKGNDAGAGAWQIDGPTGPPAGAWTHVALTCDGTTSKLYFNGNLAVSGACGPLVDSTGLLHLGGNAIWPNEFLDGVLDDVRAYDKALTVEQIRKDRDTRLTG